MFNNYEDAISKFSIAARKNCGNAHNELGVLHYHGLAPGLLPKISNNIDSNSNNNNDDNNSMTNAFSYFQRAAELHNCAGINNLGMMYELGQGTTSRDLAHAVRCYELAAEEGYLPAIANLGRLLLQTASIDLKFADGAHGGEEKVEQFEAIQQVDRAIFNLRRASDLGDARSSLELGIVFASGVHSWSETTVPRDAVAALSHFKRACAISRGEHQGHNTDEANKNKTTMKESSSKTAHKNDTLKVAAKLAAGLLYDEGRMSEAYSYYETSASIGDVESYNCLGIMCEEGKVSERKWLQPPTSTTKLTHSIRLARLVRSCVIKNAPRFARRRGCRLMFSRPAPSSSRAVPPSPDHTPASAASTWLSSSPITFPTVSVLRWILRIGCRRYIHY